MLVAAFEIEVGGQPSGRASAAFEHEGMGAARIEPHVENVGDALIILGVVVAAQVFLRALGRPGIDALLAFTPRRCAR
jgi:hypothetical protein